MISPEQENEPPKAYQPLTVKVDSAETPPKDLRTPVKSLSQGFYFHSHQQYSHTPTTRPHHGLLSGVASPQLHTPRSGSVSRTANLCRQPLSADYSAKSTPKFTTPGGTSHRVVRNPFESPGQVAQLQDHMFSPNCLKQVAPGSAEKTPQTFRWSIDQIALLDPADIEEMPIQQDTLNIRKDSRTEARLQTTIDRYFNQEMVAPSPLSRPPPKHVLPQTPGSNNIAAGSPMLGYLRETGRYVNEEPQKKPQCNGNEQYTYREACGANESAMVADSSMRSDIGVPVASTSADSSSLRRKLFFHGDVGTPLSPVRQQRHSLEERYTRDRPVPSPAQFSSSPIRASECTPMRRCSTAPTNLDALASPLLSPISIEAEEKECLGVFELEEEEADVDNVADQHGPMHATPSPLAQGACSRTSRQPTRRSLDLSPIADGMKSSSSSSSLSRDIADGMQSSSSSSSMSREEERAFSRLSHSPPASLSVGSSPGRTSPQLGSSSSLLIPASPPLSPSLSLFSQHRSGILKLDNLDEGMSLLSECDPTTSQDTGYSTEETVGMTVGTMHTNLTTQFGGLLEAVTPSSSVLFTLDPGLGDDNACSFETAIPISHSRQQRPKTHHHRHHHRPMSISRQVSEPAFTVHHDTSSSSRATSISTSTTSSSALLHGDQLLMRSLPESLLSGIGGVDGTGASIPISISRQPSVVSLPTSGTLPPSPWSAGLQAMNEASPPMTTTSAPHVPPPAPSDDAIIRRARRVLGIDSPMDLGTPAGAGVRGLPRGVNWYMDSTTDTPDRKRMAGLSRALAKRQHDVHNMLPSEIAYEALRKAGVDYNRVVSGQQLDDTCYYEDGEHTDMSFTS